MRYAHFSAAQSRCADLRTYYELALSWREVPPADVQLARIAAYLGLPAPSSAPAASQRPDPSGPSPAVHTYARPRQTPEQQEQGLQQAAMHGIPIFQGPLPADMAALLADLPLE